MLIFVVSFLLLHQGGKGFIPIALNVLFSCLGSEQGERPVNSSLLTLDHLFRWTLSSPVERRRERDMDRGMEEVTDKGRRVGNDKSAREGLGRYKAEEVLVITLF